MIFEWARAVLEDDRHYYFFDDIEALRKQMLSTSLTLEVEDYGANSSNGIPVRRRVSLRQLAKRSSSSPVQGRWLFRTAQWMRPKRILELGTGVGIGTAYLTAGAGKQAKIISLEGCPTCARVAEVHLNMLHISESVSIRSGHFAQTLSRALQDLGSLDLVFFDGHHEGTATIAYFEQCLPFSHANTLFIFDDIYWSADMTAAWQRIRNHPRIRFSIDSFDLAFAFSDPAIREKQHFSLCPIHWKPWRQWM